jgi:hypothetical protein
MPEFHEREPEHQEWKRAVLAGEIELPEIDTTPYNVPTNQTPTKKVAAPFLSAAAGGFDGFGEG